MSTCEQVCYTLACDDCGRVYDDGEGRETHFESAEAIRFYATHCDEWSTDDGGDFCPSCVCAKVGHRVRGYGGVVECTRCYDTPVDTVTPNEAYL